MAWLTDGDLLFFTAVSLLLLHEMDAIDKNEWHLILVLRQLPDDNALRWFIVLHLPWLVALMALVAAADSTAIRWVESGVDAFLIIHAGLHARLGFRGERTFANPFSRTLIWSAAALGALHVLYLLMRSG